MSIPYTQQVNVSSVSLINSDYELFAFAIQSFRSATYLNDFIANLDDYLPSFVFSRRGLQKHIELEASGKSTVTPLERARELLQKTKRDQIHSSGELGEFLLYLFAKHVKNAHKLVSKIQSRGSERTTLPGRDGIFLWEDDSRNVYLLTGEAKVMPDSNDGLREAQSDMNRFWEGTDINHEVHLASNHIRDELSEDTFPQYELYFVDDAPEHQDLKYMNIIFVGYDSSAFHSLVTETMTYGDFEQAAANDLTRCFDNQASLISASTCPSLYCFVPFESVAAAREAFAEHNNLLR